ncbi:MAG: rhodanese-like domain-containing protein [Phycisphaeraceae bacterium]
MAEPNLDEHGLPEGYCFRPDWEVTPRQVRAMRERDEHVVVVDCRTPAEAQTADLGADKLVPLQEAAQRLDELLPYREEKIVVHCHHGGRSLQMAAMLRQQGFVDVTSMAGGIDLWSRDVDPSVPRY